MNYPIHLTRYVNKLVQTNGLNLILKNEKQVT
jgi:hypothetical protein